MVKDEVVQRWTTKRHTRHIHRLDIGSGAEAVGDRILAATAAQSL